MSRSRAFFWGAVYLKKNIYGAWACKPILREPEPNAEPVKTLKTAPGCLGFLERSAAVYKKKYREPLPEQPVNFFRGSQKLGVGEKSIGSPTLIKRRPKKKKVLSSQKWRRKIHLNFSSAFYIYEKSILGLRCKKHVIYSISPKI